MSKPKFKARKAPPIPTWDNQISQQLWLPDEDNCIRKELSHKSSSFEPIINNAWFSVKKRVAIDKRGVTIRTGAAHLMSKDLVTTLVV